MDILRRALLAILFVASTGAVAAGQEETTLTTQAARLDSEGARQPAQVTSRFAADFAAFAGSQENAEALITGLRTGSPITLTSVSPAGTVTSTTITPPTRPMGYGNTYISLSLAKAQLAQYGISEPTPEQLQAALTGGSFTVTTVAADGTVSSRTVTLQGILTQRAAGMGWGEIAKANGFRLGEVISSMKAAAPAQASGSVTAPAGSKFGETAAKSASGQGSGRGITTALSGGGVVYGKSVRAEGNGRGTVQVGAGQGGGQGAARVTAVTTGAGAPGNSANAPGHTKAR
ncbi:MAG: hypothetical protein K6T56_02400 [Burkholderiales bacterium]|nr:hypothetical protein [Burkholderiales bacterium]